MRSTFLIQHTVISTVLVLCLLMIPIACTQSGANDHDYDNKFVKHEGGRERQTTLTLLASELLSRSAADDGLSLVIASNGNTASFECTGNSEQSIAACGQRCLAIQNELESTHAPEGGCSSINNGCQCTHDPFE